jgi:hypothetical protein
MTKINIPFLILVFPVLSFAQGSTLTIENYLSQVQSTSPGMESSSLLQEASVDLQDEAQHIYAPSLFTDYSHTYDKRQTLVPTFQGTKTVTDDLSFGLNQSTNFGLDASAYYNMTSSEVFGADPAFYPQPNLHVHSLNLELNQSILRNGFGRSTRSSVIAKNSI